MKQHQWVVVATLGVVAGLVAMLVWRLNAPASVVAQKDVQVATVKTPAIPAEPAPSAAPSAPTRGHGDEEIEVCGVGFVPADEAVQALQNAFVPTPELMGRVSNTLRASASPPARALGLWLTAINATDQAVAPLNAELELCGGDRACAEPLWKELAVARREAARSGVDALAREAADSNDAAVYAMAVQACGVDDSRIVGEGNCQLINLQRWAQLDPDNAVPWTHLASDALLRNQPEAASEALYRASIAGTSRMYGDSLLSIAEPALSNGLTQAERRQLATRLLILQMGWGLPSYGTPMKMCSEDALRDSNRHQTCDAYASMLIDKGNTLVERAIGTRLAERLHWPTERLEALRKERIAMSLAQEDNVSNPLGCEAQERSIDRILQGAHLGEIGRGRAAIAASGKSIDEWARVARERAAAAASAAPPASSASGA